MSEDARSKENPKVSVIVPTMASRARTHLLKRAVESIRRSSNTSICIIVVVNGNRFDIETCEWLKAQPDVKYDYLEIPSAPNAVLRGRELVTSEFFSTLDDDDEYLDGATDCKMRIMDSDSSIDLLVTNGYRHLNGVDRVFYPSLKEVTSHPLRCLLNFNWLHNCNALYRTTSVELQYFKDSHPYGEWTWLAFKFAMSGKKIGTLETPTFRYHNATESLSKSEDYQNAYLSLFKRMLACEPPTSIAHAIHRKIGAAWHDASVAAMENGNRMVALKCHWRSLVERGGIRYLSYSRYFFMLRR